MSIILDALRRGRRGQTPARGPNTAQTEAVLQTLGYGRVNARTRSIRLKRTLAVTALGLVVGFVLWAAVIWMARTYLIPPAPERATVPQVAPTARTSRAITANHDPFERAMMYQRLGEFENALVSYRQVLQRDDLNVEAHNNLGVLYRDKGLVDDAIRHFQRAIAIEPGYARARTNLGAVYLTQRKLDLAATQFHEALAIDPNDVESMVNLSTVEKDLGRLEQSREWLTRALEVNPRKVESEESKVESKK